MYVWEVCCDYMGNAHKNCTIGKLFCLHNITGTAFIIWFKLYVYVVGNSETFQKIYSFMQFKWANFISLTRRGRGGVGITARLRLNAPWLDNCVRQDCDISHSEWVTIVVYRMNVIREKFPPEIKHIWQNVKVCSCADMPTWCGACPHMECGHAPCFSHQEKTFHGILLSA